MNSASQPIAQQRLKECLDCKKTGNLKAAVSQFKELLEEFPEFMPGWMELGRLYRQMGDRSLALVTFEEAKKIKPNHVNSRLELATEQFHLNQLKESKDNLEALLEIDPNHTMALIKLGEIYRKQQDRKQAMDCFKKALESNPSYLWANIHVAIGLGDAGLFDEAQQQLQTALEYHPNDFNILMQLGELQLKRQDREGAIVYYQKAAEVQPHRLEPSLKIADTFRILKRFDEAKTYLTQCLEQHPKEYRLLIQLGQLERHRGEREEALNWFNQAAQTAPNPPQVRDAQLFSIELLRELNRLDEAVETIELVLQQWPNNIRANLIFGNIRQRQLDYSAAADIYRDILRLDDKNLYANLHLAQTLGESGKTEEAIELLEGVQEIFRDNLPIQIQLGALYRRQQNPEKAMEYFQNALSADPTDLWANIHLGISLGEAGLFDEAQQKLQTALKHHPQDLNVLLRLGEIEQKRQRPKEAIAYFQQARNFHQHQLEPSLKIAQTLTKFSQFDRAETELNQLLEQYPNEYRILIELGHLERQRGRREPALHWYTKASDTASNASQGKNARLFAMEELRELGRFDEARQEIELLLQQDPENVRAKTSLGNILQQQLDLPTAANLYEEVLETDPKHLQARLQLATTLSQSGQVGAAIKLLQETYELLGPEIQVFMQLGQLAIAQEDWQTARRWYEEAYQHHRDRPQVCVALAHVMFLQGEIDEGFHLLEEAQNRLPDGVDISIKIAEQNMRLGNLELSKDGLQAARDRFPNHVPLLLLLSRVYMTMGDYEAADRVLDEIQSDRAAWLKQIEQIRGEMAMNQYDFNGGALHFRNSIAHSPTTHDRNRLAISLMMMGKIDEASAQLQLATEELGLKTPPGKVPIPLIGHPAMVINGFRIVPPLLAELMEAQEETREDRLLALAGIIAQDPSYLGAALYLARELRQQSIFDEIRKALPGPNTHLPSIPKRIVQYWDETDPPKEVQQLCQSWKEFNPDYKYIRFSFYSAIAFLKEHYDNRVVNAFKLCDKPATQADFFRLAYLNQMGGFYADADDRCRKSLDTIVALNPELVVQQEDFACIGNNFIGCIPGQTAIRTSFYEAICNFENYSNDGPWFKTGPGLLTCKLCSSLLPYLTYTNYQMWPRLLVLSLAQFRSVVAQHIRLPYKNTDKSWSHEASYRRLSRS